MNSKPRLFSDGDFPNSKKNLKKWRRRHQVFSSVVLLCRCASLLPSQDTTSDGTSQIPVVVANNSRSISAESHSTSILLRRTNLSSSSSSNNSNNNRQTTQAISRKGVPKTTMKHRLRRCTTARIVDCYMNCLSRNSWSSKIPANIPTMRKLISNSMMRTTTFPPHLVKA